ncbi:Hydrogenase maturation factor HoxO/HyaE [hydrothermal vent metagenome]|uniref:Hydrogenase maturation factor HoxO/HyaE n=1 Tax=hydrothermal vent metagenome TaxID=652676 RepID=A0A1W1BZG5_9ZZZZ
MFPELVEQLITKHHYPLLIESDIEKFIKKHHYSVLFFCNDTKLFPETLDVAVILPELISAFDGKIIPAVVSRDDEINIQRHYGFTTWPSLVFFKDGGYLGTISKVRNWDEYISEIKTFMMSKPTTPPIKIALSQL